MKKIGDNLGVTLQAAKAPGGGMEPIPLTRVTSTGTRRSIDLENVDEMLSALQKQ
jgi:hypothetical protein